MPEIYLDWNSTTPLADEVWNAMQARRSELWGNPASVHGAGRRARAELELLREGLASALGFQAREVVLTCGGTEANNLALHAAEAVIASQLDHPSIVRVAERLQHQGRVVRWLPISCSGLIDAADVKRAFEQVPSELHRRTIVAVTAANHETGVLQPVNELAQVVHGYQARLHVDAVQLLGKASTEVLDSSDSATVTAHKIRGPKGIGALLCRGSAPIPLLVGGAQERGLRPGTQDGLLALGFRVALERALDPKSRNPNLDQLRDHLERALVTVAVANVTAVPRLAHVANLAFSAIPGPELAAALDLEGIRVSSGSACAAGTLEPSPVIAAMWGKERARGSLRFSFGETTTQADVDAAIAAIFRVIGVARAT
jgi:cysteine desulfurase